MDNLPVLTAEQIAELQRQGKIGRIGDRPVEQSPEEQKRMSIARAALATEKARIGGQVGGGLGMGAGAAAASWLAGPEVGLPVSLGAMLLGATAGGYAGEKAEEAALSEDTYRGIQEEAAQAMQQHPAVSTATELVAGGLLGGGKPSLSNLRYALGGNPGNLTGEALASARQFARANVLTGNAINVGASTGLSAASQLYNTGTIDPTELAKEAALGAVSGAIFTNPNWLGKTLNPRWHNLDEHLAAIEEAHSDKDIDILDDQTDKHDEILASSKAQIDAEVAKRRIAALTEEQQAHQARIEAGVKGAELFLDPTQVPDTMLQKNFKKLFKKVSPSMDITDQAAAAAHNQMLSAMTNEQKRQALYIRQLHNVDPELAQQALAKAQQDDQYVQWWKEQKKQQDAAWVANEKAKAKAEAEAAVRARDFPKSRQQDVVSRDTQDMVRARTEEVAQSAIPQPQPVVRKPMTENQIRITNPQIANQILQSAVARPVTAHTPPELGQQVRPPMEPVPELTHGEQVQNKFEGMKFAPVDPNGTRRLQGADVNRAMNLLGSSMYDKNLSQTAVKELVQNAFDGLKGAGGEREIACAVDAKNRRITLGDTGKGMTPEVIATKFLPAFVSGKEAENSAGGYGLAKIAFLGGSEEFHVETVSTVNGKHLKSTLTGTGEKWKEFVNNGAEIPPEINKAGTYDIGGLKLHVEEVSPRDTYTRVTVQQPEGKFDSWSAQKTFQNIAELVPYDTKMLLHHQYVSSRLKAKSVDLNQLHKPDEYTQFGHINVNKKADEAPQHEVVTNGAKVKVYYNPNEKPESIYRIPITNNFLHQFDMNFMQDVKLPKLHIEVTPTVDVTNDAYPYGPNRDTLKGETKPAVERIIANIAQSYKEKQLELFRKRTTSNDKIGNTKQVFMDLTGKMTPEAKKAITNDEGIQRLSKLLDIVHKEAFENLNRRHSTMWKDAHFAGFATGGEFYGVRFGTASPGSKGEIYYDLGLLFKEAANAYADGHYDTLSESFGEHLAGVMLHEVAHQISSQEGETHARAMTFIAGVMRKEINNVVNRIQKLYPLDHQYDELYNRYKAAVGDAVKATAESSDLVGKAKSGGFENTGSATKLGTSDAELWEPNDLSKLSHIPEHIEQHIVSGRATVGSVLEKFAAETSHPYSKLAKAILDKADSASLTDRVTYDRNSTEDRSGYDINNKRVYLRADSTADAKVVMHEIVHAATIAKVPKNMIDGSLQGIELRREIQDYLDHGKHDDVKELLRCYLQAAKGLGIEAKLFGAKGVAGKATERGVKVEGAHWETGYAMMDPGEFMSQIFSSAEFRYTLNALESGRADGKSLWSRLIDAVSNLLGFNVREGSLLERSLKATHDLMDNPRNMESDPNMEKYSSYRSTDDSGIPFEKGAPTRPSDDKSEYGKDVLTRTIGRLTEAANVRIARNGVEGKRLAAAIDKTLIDARQNAGKWWTAVDDVTRKLTEQQRKNVDTALHQEVMNKRSMTFMLKSPAERAAYTAIRKVLAEIGDYHEKIGEPIIRGGKPTKMIRDEWHYPTTEELRVGDIIRQNTDQAKIAELRKAYVDHYARLNPKEGFEGAEHAWKEFVSAHQGSAKNNSTPSLAIFNAMRKQAGTPLPNALRRTNLRENLFNYIRRSSMDMAHYKNIESDHKVAASLGYNTDAWGNQINTDGIRNIHGNNAVRAVMDEIRGEVEPLGHRNERATENIANALILGPLTEVHKMLSSISQAVSYTSNPIDAAKMIYSAATNIGKAWTSASKGGVVMHRPNDVSDFMSAHLTPAERMNAVANNIRKVYTINGLTERFTVGMAQAAGEYLLPTKAKMASNGNEAAQRLMKWVDPDWKAGKSYSKEEFEKMASTFATMLHGTKDARTLPEWMLRDGEVAAFFKLLNWNIAQTNNFMNHVWQPALKGNLTPLIMSTFGASLGGFVIKELREKLAGKEGQIPSLQEMQASSRGVEGNIPLVAYNWIASAAYGGLGGIISLTAKYPLDIMYRNQMQGAVFPLDEVVSNYSKIAVNIADAMVNDPTFNALKVTSRAFTDIITKNTQVGRVALNQLINSGAINEESPTAEMRELAYEKQTSDKLRELKRFKQVEGLPVNPMTDVQSNPYLGMEQKEFKHDTNLQRSVEESRALVKEYMEKYRDNPEVLMAKLEGLKANPYTIMPSLETHPMMFSKYIKFLQNKIGEDETNHLLQSYLQRKALNSAKAGLIP